MLRTVFLALPLAVVGVLPASASSLTFQEQANIFVESGDFDGAGLLGQDLFGSWVISSDFSDGQDENVGIPDPTYDVQVTFDNVALGFADSRAEIRDPGGSTVTLGSQNFETTAIFYQDNVDLSADVIGSPFEPYIDTTILYDIFELNAANTIGFQDPNTGEFSPAAPSGEGTADELSLFILADASWFSGAPSAPLTLPSEYISFIQYTSYNEAAEQVGFFAATNAPEVAPVPLPAALPMLLVALGGLMTIRRRRARV